MAPVRMLMAQVTRRDPGLQVPGATLVSPSRLAISCTPSSGMVSALEQPPESLPCSTSVVGTPAFALNWVGTYESGRRP